jgi:hypothetical protein
MGSFVVRCAALAALAAMPWCSLALAATPPAEQDNALPNYAFFVQRGLGEEIGAFAIGLMRRGPWTFFGERLNVYGEVSLNAWSAHTHYPSDTGTLVQLGVKPVVRYNPAPGELPLFVELGIGLTVSSEIYRKNERQFSTAYNFGDHLGIGFAFGERHENEIALRVEHFSNGNLKLPNPGENFRELRYVRWF